ncbi:hypothetical protein DRP53_04160 [candidate division WOR-3 bacterium]|uniref:Retroviral-like aspartic protease n=1 Tax=candidate division WOR-3 bacterium TaxID=2052148 RepID=A0A660SKR7_UNCW3|nr:MAG: hypothetical protein DRP53_04160 [candidate division WOR-3 bacterium]
MFGIVNSKLQLLAVFDSGATYSCIQPELAERLGVTEPLPAPKHFGTAKKERRLLPERPVRLDFENDEVIIDPRATKLRLL